MVSGVGRTPPLPPPESNDESRRLTRSLKNQIDALHHELSEVMQNPHLADSKQSLENLAHTIDALSNLSRQASRSS
jgi:hypothetical protein